MINPTSPDDGDPTVVLMCIFVFTSTIIFMIAYGWDQGIHWWKYKCRKRKQKARDKRRSRYLLSLPNRKR